MAGRHQGNTKEFRELSFAEQANSITATINNLQAAIEHHVGHSPRRRETIETCSAQVDRLRLQLESRYDLRLVPPGGGEAITSVGGVPRIRVGSPRLAEPGRAADFTMDIAEETQDAGLR